MRIRALRCVIQGKIERGVAVARGYDCEQCYEPEGGARRHGVEGIEAPRRGTSGRRSHDLCGKAGTRPARGFRNRKKQDLLHLTTFGTQFPTLRRGGEVLRSAECQRSAVERDRWSEASASTIFGCAHLGQIKAPRMLTARQSRYKLHCLARARSKASAWRSGGNTGACADCALFS